MKNSLCIQSKLLALAIAGGSISGVDMFVNDMVEHRANGILYHRCVAYLGTDADMAHVLAMVDPFQGDA